MFFRLTETNPKNPFSGSPPYRPHATSAAQAREPLHVVVIGAGLVGTTTAFALAQRGARVTLVDRCSEVAGYDGASFANGGR